MSHEIVKTFEFQGKPLAFREAGDDWFVTAAEVAGALGYAGKDEVLRLWDRHRAEFKPGETCTVKLTAQAGGQARAVRVFSPRGVMKVAMLSNTPVAAAFRDFALDVLEDLRSGKKRLADAAGARGLASQVDAIGDAAGEPLDPSDRDPSALDGERRRCLVSLHRTWIYLADSDPDQKAGGAYADELKAALDREAHLRLELAMEKACAAGSWAQRQGLFEFAEAEAKALEAVLALVPPDLLPRAHALVAAAHAGLFHASELPPEVAPPEPTRRRPASPSRPAPRPEAVGA